MKSLEYIIHGTSSDADAEKIKEDGFIAEEGRATVSADLIMAFKWASNKDKRKASKSESKVESGEGGRIVIMRTPDNKTVDYGKDTDIVVDNQDKEVSGFTSRYQSGRRYLAIYNKGEDQDSEAVIPKEDILMSIVPTSELEEKLDELKKKIKNLEKVNLIEFTEALVEIIRNNKDNLVSSGDIIHEVVGNLLVSTIEAEVMNIVRTVAVDVKRAKGYKIYNKGEDKTEEKDVNVEKLKQELERYQSIVESSDFDIGIDSLNRYIKTSIHKLLE